MVTSSQATVTRLRNAAPSVGSPKDSRGKVIPAAVTPVSLGTCLVYQTATTEAPVAGRDQVVSDITVLAPYGVDVIATDQLVIGSETFDVVGEPTQYLSLSGWRAGTQILGRVVSG